MRTKEFLTFFVVQNELLTAATPRHMIILGVSNRNMLVVNPQQPSNLSKNHLQLFGAGISTLVLMRAPIIS